MRRGVGLAGWLVLASIALDLTLREVARRPLLPGGFEHGTLAIVAALAALLTFAAAPRPRTKLFAGTPILFAALFCAGVSAQLSLGARLQSDGFYYFAYLRSIAFDGDVEFTNDYRLLGLGDKAHLFQPTRTGHAHSAWTIGPAILWSPFFAGGHIVATQLSRRDPNVTANGISFPYRQAVCIAGLVYGLLGCWFMVKLAERTFARGIAAAAVAVTVCGSFMLWYMVKEPSMTHAPSMALVAGFAWAWAATRERRTLLQWVLLGLLAGLMTLVRWQNAIFAILPACDSAVALYRGWRSRSSTEIRTALLQGVAFTAAATIAFTPQMLAWRAIYGSLLAVSPVGPQIRFGDPHLVDILWSARNGLFSTAPALYAGALGLVLLAWRQPGIGLPAILAAALMTYFNASIQDWWGSAGFGGRRFDGVLPLLSLGMASAIGAAVALTRRFPGVVVGIGGTMLVLWNLTLMSAAQAGVVRIGETISFGDAMAAQVRAFHGWFGNPFTYPASLLYALRNGVGPDDYDLLSTNRLLGDPLRNYAGIDVGLGDAWLAREGWHAPEREGAITFRWASHKADLVIPLERALDIRVDFRLHAFGFPNAPPQTLTLVVNGHRHGPIPVSPDWHNAELVVPKDAWRTGVNDVSLEFAWGTRPADVGLGGDGRELAAAIDYFRLTRLD